MPKVAKSKLSSHCCRPVSKRGICNTLYNLSESITENIIKITGQNPTTKLICVNCRRKVDKIALNGFNGASINQTILNNDCDMFVPEIELIEKETNEEEFVTNASENLAQLNKLLEFMGTDTCKSNVYSLSSAEREKEAERICNAICFKIFNINKTYKCEDETLIEESQNFRDIVCQLQEKFSSPSSTSSEKFQILTILPRTFTAQKIVKTIKGATPHNANKAKEMVEKEGILATPQKLDRTENPINDKVRAFYLEERTSRPMPGIRDYVMIKNENGLKSKLQKRLMIYTVKEAYENFKKDNPQLKISISKFYDLRPEQCVLPNSNGIHKVCLCETHENFKLLLKAVPNLSFENKDDIFNESTCMKKITCPDPSIKCFLRKCTKCKDVKEMKTYLETIFRDNLEGQITFKQWVNIEKMCDLKPQEKSVQDFITLFLEKLQKFIYHYHTAERQSKYLISRKSNLKTGEVLVIGDFSENFSFLHAYEVQSYHWTNKQCTIHPFVLYFLDENMTMQHRSFTVISESLKHDAIAVHHFLKLLQGFIKGNVFENPKKIIYFSDGAGSQYKNRFNFHNLCFHKSDFGVKAEWHFFCTSHGKGPCDAIGGHIKRMAKDKILQKGYDNTIRDARSLYEFLKSKETKINFAFATTQDYISTGDELKTRFDTHPPVFIKDTQKYHSFIPSAKNKTTIDVRYFSDEHNCVSSTKICK